MDSQLKVRKTFYGSESANTCAYCCLHHYSLTPKQMRQKRCLKKSCRYLIRHEHPFWDIREQSKKNRQLRKARLEAKYEAVRRKST